MLAGSVLLQHLSVLDLPPATPSQRTCSPPHRPALLSAFPRSALLDALPVCITNPTTHPAAHLQIPGCLTPQEAAKLVAAAEAAGFTHQSSRGPAYGEAFRDNDRIQFTDQQFADHMWEACGLRQLLDGQLEDDEGVAVGLNPNIR